MSDKTTYSTRPYEDVAVNFLYENLAQCAREVRMFYAGEEDETAFPSDGKVAQLAKLLAPSCPFGASRDFAKEMVIRACLDDVIRRERVSEEKKQAFNKKEHPNIADRQTMVWDYLF